MAVDFHHVHHFGSRIHGDTAFSDFFFKSLITADEELLTSLTTGIESTRNLSSTKGAVIEKATVFTCKWHTLSSTLIDDIIRNFSETVDIGFACAEVATFYSIIEKTVNRVAIVLVVLSSIYTTLSRNRVSAARAVLITEAFHLIPHL